MGLAIHEFEYRDLVSRMGKDLADKVIASRGLQAPRNPSDSPIDLTDKPALSNLTDMLITVRNHRRKEFLIEARAIRKAQVERVAAA